MKTETFEFRGLSEANGAEAARKYIAEWIKGSGI